MSPFASLARPSGAGEGSFHPQLVLVRFSLVSEPIFAGEIIPRDRSELLLVVLEVVAAREAWRSRCVAVGVSMDRLLEEGADPVVISGGSGMGSFSCVCSLSGGVVALMRLGLGLFLG